VPSGVFPVPKFRSKPSRITGAGPSLAVRVRTRLRRNRLDDELARGIDPDLTPELALRAVQLHSPAERARLAGARAHPRERGRPAGPRPPAA
jgi:hypothetical protein